MPIWLRALSWVAFGVSLVGFVVYGWLHVAHLLRPTVDTNATVSNADIILLLSTMLAGLFSMIMTGPYIPYKVGSPTLITLAEEARRRQEMARASRWTRLR